MVEKENIKLNEKQVDELIELLEKEEVLEVESKIQKALEKEKSEDGKDEGDKKNEKKISSDASNTKSNTQSIVPPPIASIDPTKKKDDNTML